MANSPTLPIVHAHCPHLHALKPMSSSSKNIGESVLENLAPLIIRRRDSKEHFTQHLQPLAYTVILTTNEALSSGRNLLQ